MLTTFAEEVSNARVNTDKSSVHDHDRTNEDAVEEGGDGGDGNESLPPNSPRSPPLPPTMPRSSPSPALNEGGKIGDDTGNGDDDGEPQAWRNDSDESGEEDGQESDTVPAGSTSPQDMGRPAGDEVGARKVVTIRAPKRRHRQGGASLRAKLASARWLQNWWRRLRSMQSAVGRADGRVWPGYWRRCSPWIRPRTNPRCLSQGIAEEGEFKEQAERAAGGWGASRSSARTSWCRSRCRSRSLSWSFLSWSFLSWGFLSWGLSPGSVIMWYGGCSLGTQSSKDQLERAE